MEVIRTQEKTDMVLMGRIDGGWDSRWQALAWKVYEEKGRQELEKKF